MRATLWNLIARVIVLGMLISAANDCNAHDKWANGTAIPAWVKSHCCNGDEAEDLGTADIVHPITKDGAVIAYRVDGFKNEVESWRVYPSQDGHVWVFRQMNTTHWEHDHYMGQVAMPQAQAKIWCMFVPCAEHSDPDHLGPNDVPSDLDSSCS